MRNGVNRPDPVLAALVEAAEQVRADTRELVALRHAESGMRAPSHAVPSDPTLSLPGRGRTWRALPGPQHR